MGLQIQQIFAALTTYPGNIVYHIIINFSILNALVSAYSNPTKEIRLQEKRTQIGLWILLGIRVFVFVYSALVDTSSPASVLPILDWFTTCISLIALIWLWFVPEHSQVHDIFASLVVFITTIFAVLSVGWWSGEMRDQYFNMGFVDNVWNYFSMAILVVGIVLVYLRMPLNFGVGLGMLGTLFLGHILHAAFPNTDANFPGGVRLFQMAAYPLLFSVSRRWKSYQDEAPAAVEEPFNFVDTGPYRLTPDEFRNFITLFADLFPLQIDQLVLRIVGEIMKADLMFLIVRTSDDHFILKGGFDRHLQREIDEISLRENQIPLLASSFRKSISLRLQASSTSIDLYHLGEALGLKSTGHMLAGFFSTVENVGILLLTPHSQKRWDQGNQQYFVEITNTIHTFFKNMENHYLLIDEDKIEIIPDPHARRESKIDKDTLLKLISFLKMQSPESTKQVRQD